MPLARSWPSLVAQAGLLVGLALAFAGGAAPPAGAAPFCNDRQCVAKKPLILFVLDASTAMNQQHGMLPTTRWQAAVGTVSATIDAQNGYLPFSALLGLMIYGHDPDPGAPGTTIPGDGAGLVDGQRLLVGFYDADSQFKQYFECNGEALKSALADLPPPLDGAPDGIGAWTRGALDRAGAYIDQTIADHPKDMGHRPAALVVLTQGRWTDATGATELQPPADDPALPAFALFNEREIPTYVVPFGDGELADKLAAAGGTTAALTPAQLLGALGEFISAAAEAYYHPVCTRPKPRIMVLLDASSPMLNVGTMAGLPGETPWDRARAAIAGGASLFDAPINALMTSLEVTFHAGLAVFGDPAPPGEQALLVEYGPCRQDQLAWALDPLNSCSPPGCLDPWSGPPIAWTFKDGALLDPPGFPDMTRSHMPRCDPGDPFPLACAGSGAALHLGLELVRQHVADYRAQCQQPDAAQPCDADTLFLNILVTEGRYDSTDAEVQAVLEQMHADGVVTYVLGVGDARDPVKLEKLAAWGSGGLESWFPADDQAALHATIVASIEELAFDPCCPLPACSPPVCGDGMLEFPEECDDGNLADGDGCSAACAFDEIIGSTSSTGDATTTTTGSTGGSTTGSSDPTTAATTADGTTSDGTSATTGAATTFDPAASTGATTTSADPATAGPAGDVAVDGCTCDARRDAPRELLLLAAVLALARRRARGRPARLRARGTSPIE